MNEGRRGSGAFNDAGVFSIMPQIVMLDQHVSAHEADKR